jgi:hypothetical protein
LFEGGKAELLIATVKTARREKLGTLIFLIQLRAAVISTKIGLRQRDAMRQYFAFDEGLSRWLEA